MPHFTVRVELHDARWSDYEHLHAAMERRGFSRFIVSDDGRKFHLPWAEYNASAPMVRARVLEAARAAASSTGKNGSVLVTEARGRIWWGLAVYDP